MKIRLPTAGESRLLHGGEAASANVRPLFDNVDDVLVPIAGADGDVLDDLREFKLPAMQQAGFNVSDSVPLVLSSRAGFSKQVQEAANGDSRIRLVEVATLLEQVR